METAVAKAEAKPLNRTMVMMVLLSGAFVAILNETLLNVALPPIMRDFHVNASVVQWLTTAYLLTNGVLIPVTAFLVQKFSTRSLFIVGMGIFSFGTLIAGISPDFTVLLAARVAQASGAAIILPLLMNVVLAVYPVKERGAAMGLVGLVITFAPAIGPTLSGWLITHHNWHIVFFVVLPIAVLDIIFALFSLGDVLPRNFPRIDFTSIVLSTIGFGGLLYGFSAAGSAGWTASEVWISLAAAVAALFGFIVRQFSLAQPMLEFRVFRYSTFTLSIVVTGLVFMTMFSAMLLLPIYLQTVRGFTPFASGLLVLPGAVLMGAMSPIAGRIFDRVGGRWLGLAGSVLLVAAMIRFADLTGATSYLTLMTAYAGLMLGMSLIMMPVMTAGLNHLPAHLYPHGTAMSNTLQQVAGAVGTGLLVTMMTDAARSNLRHLLATRTSPRPSVHQLTLTSTIHGMDVAFTAGAAFAVAALILCVANRNPSHPAATYVAQSEPG